jgi:hypothetical protein
LICAGVGDIQGLGDVGTLLLDEGFEEVYASIKVSTRWCRQPYVSLDCVEIIGSNSCHEMADF